MNDEDIWIGILLAGAERTSRFRRMHTKEKDRKGNSSFAVWYARMVK